MTAVYFIIENLIPAWKYDGIGYDEGRDSRQGFTADIFTFGEHNLEAPREFVQLCEAMKAVVVKTCKTESDVCCWRSDGKGSKGGAVVCPTLYSIV